MMCLAVPLALIAATNPRALAAATGAVLLAGAWVGALLTPFAMLLLLLVYLPFEPFVDAAFPPVGSVLFGALVRDYLVLVILTASILRGLLRRRRRPPLYAPYLATALYVALMALHLPGAQSLAGGLVSFRNLALYWLMLFVSSELITSVSRLRMLTLAILVPAGVFGVVGIAEVVTNRQIFGWLHYDIEALMGTDLPYTILGLPRATGGTGNPLEFGLLMAIGAVLCTVHIAASGLRRWGRFMAPVLIIVFVALALTFARSAYVSLAVGLLATSFFFARRRLLVPLAVLGVLALGLAQTPYGGQLQARLKFEDEAGITTANQRVDVWQEVLVRGVSVWSGSGLGSQGGAVERSGASPLLSITDNYYALIGLQVGWGAVVCFLAILLTLVRHYLGLLRLPSPPEVKAHAAGCVAIVMMIAGNAALSSALESKALSILIATVLGAGLGLAGPRSTAGSPNALAST
jgi:hypothetical protein